MSGETHVVITGNATEDAVLRFTRSGIPVASFSVAHSDRVKDQQGNWVDGPATFYRVNAWRHLGEGAAESVRKGRRVVVSGVLAPSTYQARDGQERLSLDVTADDIGLSVLFDAMKGQHSGQQQRPRQDPGVDPWSQQSTDPWAAQSAEAPF
ncbi:single-stranded DNA-binding protein [Cutibacterium avidum]|uniref:single-stranded DNA-binding protein n=1 Tax=Cutibacterium avidum TaxID=33010 RepID=UPI002FF22D4F